MTPRFDSGHQNVSGVALSRSRNKCDRYPAAAPKLAESAISGPNPRKTSQHKPANTAAAPNECVGPRCHKMRRSPSRRPARPRVLPEPGSQGSARPPLTTTPCNGINRPYIESGWSTSGNGPASVARATDTNGAGATPETASPARRPPSKCVRASNEPPLPA